MVERDDLVLLVTKCLKWFGALCHRDKKLKVKLRKYSCIKALPNA